MGDQGHVEPGHRQGQAADRGSALEVKEAKRQVRDRGYRAVGASKAPGQFQSSRVVWWPQGAEGVKGCRAAKGRGVKGRGSRDRFGVPVWCARLVCPFVCPFVAG